MEFHQRIKKGARNALRGHWGKAIAILMVFGGVLLLLSTLEQFLYLIFHYSGYLDVLQSPEFYLDDILDYHLGPLLITGSICILWLLLIPPMIYGIASWYYHLSGGSPKEFSAVFCAFTSLRQWARSVGMTLILLALHLFWLAVFTVIPVLVLLFFRNFTFDPASRLAIFIPFGKAGGWILLTMAMVFYLVLIQRYALCFYLMAQKPRIPLLKAIRQSVQAMQGRSWEMISLRLSFIWWMLLSLLMFPLIYVVPYYQSAIAIYARYAVEYDIRETQQKQQHLEQQQPVQQLPRPEDAQQAQEESFDDGQTREYPVSDLQQHMGK